ncbi:MAG: helix-turn-helix domain-containing protein [Nitrosomonas sp.]
MVQSYKPVYPAEFQQQIVELVALGKNPKQLSQEFGCHVTTIRDWCRAAGVQYQSNRATVTILSSNSALLSVNERQVLIELRKEIKACREGT